MVKALTGRAILLGLAFASTLGSGIARADETQVNYNLAPGASSNAINVPATNLPIQLMGVQINAGFRGVGQATLLRVAPSSFLEWVGIDIALNKTPTAVVSSGYSASPGQHIIWLDYNQTVDVEVGSATQIKIHNASGDSAKGTITFIW